MKDQIYNYELKSKYLETIESENTKLVALSVFYATSFFEELFQKDLCYFNYGEIKQVFELKGWQRVTVISNYKNQIKKYFEWNFKNNRIDAEALLGITNLRPQDIDNELILKTEYYETLEDLLDTIQTVMNINDVSEAQITMFKCFYGLIWIGLTRDEAAAASAEDINRTDKTIFVKGRNTNINIPECLIELCLNARTLTSYLDSKGRNYQYEDYNDVPLIVRFRATKNISEFPDKRGESINRRYSRLWSDYNDNLDIYHKYKNKVLIQSKIAFCGRAERVWEYEKAANTKINNYVDFKKVFPDDYLLLNSDYNNIIYAFIFEYRNKWHKYYKSN